MPQILLIATFFSLQLLASAAYGSSPSTTERHRVEQSLLSPKRTKTYARGALHAIRSKRAFRSGKSKPDARTCARIGNTAGMLPLLFEQKLVDPEVFTILVNDDLKAAQEKEIGNWEKILGTVIDGWGACPGGASGTD